jgi:ClpP class serine protease
MLITRKIRITCSRRIYLNLFQIVLILFIISVFLPFLRQYRVNAARFRVLRSLQKKRNSQVITLIHRQEFLSFLGVNLTRFINIEDSEQILRAIRLTPGHTPIDLILHTPGGLILASEQISAALQKHPAKVTVFVPHYAMSGGTMIALSADEIVMDENAVLGPVDPQIGSYPAVSILKAVELKNRNRLDDQTLILADIATKAVKQVEDTIYRILLKHMDEDKSRQIALVLSQGRWTHDFPLTSEILKEFGLRISNDVPWEIYSLMAFYPQPPSRRPSVQYIPLPGESGENPEDRK